MRKLLACLCAILPLFALSSSAFAASWFDRSHAIFFPPVLKEKLNSSQSFPLFWWNFLVLEVDENARERDWEMARRTCAYLKTRLQQSVLRVECEQRLSEVTEWLADWQAHLPLRHPSPGTTQLKSSLNLALAKASLPLGDQSILQLLRVDPLESWRELLALAESRVKIPFERKRGFFYDDRTKRIVIPLQLAFPPGETAQTASLFETSPERARWTFLGPHASTIKNEEQISHDMKIVSDVGLLLLGIAALGLVLSRRWSVVLLVPPMGAAMGVAVVATIAVFGTIHGLTLSFGAGIVGLGLDYGLHAMFNTRGPQVWRSNLFGLFTTAAGLVVLMCSSVPLLRQMMFFSLVGIIGAYIFYYALLQRFQRLFWSKPFPLTPRPRTWKTVAASLLVMSSLVGVLSLRPNLDLKQFDFQDARSRELTFWLFRAQMKRAPLFRLHAASDALESAHDEKSWADESKIAIESLANYLPKVEEQRENLETWRRESCGQAFGASLPEQQRKFFSPFLSGSACTAGLIGPIDGVGQAPRYLSHLRAGDKWISLFLPENEAQEAAVRAHYPDAASLKDIVAVFPETFARELTWMVPLSLLLAGGVLFFYYRNVVSTLIALVPFFCGMGLVVVCRAIFGFDLSFISIMGLIMVFGFSIDYGIFARDIKFDADREWNDGVWTGLASSAVATVAGFVPMLFCKHPVLLQLGLTLTLGAAGTYIGTAWGIPGLRRWAKL